ncbi:MAG: hypothetical protein JXQ75_13105 [Phycisphaerae bacterium]|nr:hypothetical protein [Phycisphaerae bacterium]
MLELYTAETALKWRPKWVVPVVAASGLLCSAPGCSRDESKVAMSSPFVAPITFAVSPVLNFSGEFSFDPITAADLLASELSFVEGVAVLPVNRVVAYLATQGRQQIESPAHALAVAQAVGADVILVAGITEYDPYTPVVGLALQMYVAPVPVEAWGIHTGRQAASGTRPARQAANGTHTHSSPALDAVLVSRQPRPITTVETDGTPAPTGQVQKVYNAAHGHVVDAVQRYAEHRTEGQNPFGWRQYLKVQTLFLRFCWHDAIARLMEQESCRRTMLAGGHQMEVPS